MVWDNYNPGLKIRGILPTMYKKTTTHSSGVVDKAREIWGDKVFPIEVPDTILFPRAYNEGIPMPLFDTAHEGSYAYLEIARILHGVPAQEKPIHEEAQPEHHEGEEKHEDVPIENNNNDDYHEGN